MRGSLIEFEIRSGKKEIRAFTQSCGNRFTGLNPKLLCGNGLRQDNAGPLFTISANSRWDQSDVVLSHTDSAGSLPGEEGAIHIDMKYQSIHGAPPFCYTSQR